MSKTTIYDIFISYRRDGGGATAGRINDMLTADGYSVSYDVDTLREGRFDQQLLVLAQLGPAPRPLIVNRLIAKT